MNTSKKLKAMGLVAAVCVFGLAATASAGGSSHGRGRGHEPQPQHMCSTGHYEEGPVISRVLVRAGHYETVRVPEKRTEYTDRHGVRHITITPGYTKRVWVEPEYRETRRRIWVPGCECGRKVPEPSHSSTGKRGSSTRLFHDRDGWGVFFQNRSKSGSFGFTFRF